MLGWVVVAPRPTATASVQDQRIPGSRASIDHIVLGRWRVRRRHDVMSPRRAVSKAIVVPTKTAQGNREVLGLSVGTLCLSPEGTVRPSPD